MSNTNEHRRVRCARALLEIEPDNLDDAELVRYVYALRSCLAWVSAPSSAPDIRVGRVTTDSEISDLQRAIEANNWSIVAAATQLGISVQTARRRIYKYADPEWRQVYVKNATRNKRQSPGRPRKIERDDQADLADAHELLEAQR